MKLSNYFFILCVALGLFTESFACRRKYPYGEYLQEVINNNITDPAILDKCLTKAVFRKNGPDKITNHMIEQLLYLGANPNGYEWECWGSALCGAILNGDIETTKRLLTLGADPDNKTHENTFHKPLINAISFNHLDLVNLLLEHGANPNIESKNIISKLTTPLMTCVEIGFGDRRTIDERIQLLKCLLSYNVDVNKTNNDGHTASDIARANGFGELALMIEGYEKADK